MAASDLLKSWASTWTTASAHPRGTPIPVLDLILLGDQRLQSSQSNSFSPIGSKKVGPKDGSNAQGRSLTHDTAEEFDSSQVIAIGDGGRWRTRTSDLMRVKHAL